MKNYYLLFPHLRLFSVFAILFYFLYLLLLSVFVIIFSFLYLPLLSLFAIIFYFLYLSLLSVFAIFLFSVFPITFCICHYFPDREIIAKTEIRGDVIIVK